MGNKTYDTTALSLPGEAFVPVWKCLRAAVKSSNTVSISGFDFLDKALEFSRPTKMAITGTNHSLHVSVLLWQFSDVHSEVRLRLLWLDLWVFVYWQNLGNTGIWWRSQMADRGQVDIYYKIIICVLL